jgi:hypothetical protein
MSTPFAGRSGPKLGTTVYSFTRDFHGRTASFPELIRRVAEYGLGPGLEVVGFQSFRGWPAVSDEDARSFRALVDELGLTLSALGANADAALRRDRMLTDDELVAYMEAQIIAARRLGFPVVRVQYSLTPDDMERLLPIAERENVALGLEIHAHHSPRHPVMLAMLERYEKLGSPLLGFIPDWGATMRRMPPSFLEAYRAKGLPEAFLSGVEEEWSRLHALGPVLDDEVLGAHFGRYQQIAEQTGAGEAANAVIIGAVGLFGHADPTDWALVAPWTVHMHGKFYDIDLDGDEPCVPVRDILEVFLDAGYNGLSQASGKAGTGTPPLPPPK